MYKTKGSVQTENARKYLQQLCKHFAHKVDVDFTPDKGHVSFPMGQCTILAQSTLLSFEGQSEQEEGIARMKGVIISHLDKFAWREQIEYIWDDSCE
ncbi:DUF2218 domain-containing protein [Thalassospira alkalitolerans]|uniref:2,4-dihydroxyhept-2-ene-1,7-dioic acid aldolase n=1 Tax=Thalassospira alkalitolerans TaxID=1293890 RepID=A0A1Y2L8B2_9PROT|nr:DUF2218 domain-containing protein [Thalassospira alkalitolerans]OSQ46247.1 2,4-dihydroxyhept-2-ene-1,7-dioic acid aldolase [Thalassospira alkalitolerans]|tara:strand:- start:192694 stop:192984 length:291 start_codon:yes stop_codon:yes gene_type:complete